MLQGEGQPTATGPPFALLVPPPRPRVDNLSALVLIKGDADYLAFVPRPFGDQDGVDRGQILRIFRGRSGLRLPCSIV